ncbi:MAG: helix-hairpin-helix domain-containing protein [bacterium]|nr:helix-hairpin-helix domain-containing protein [bacterium]
MRATARTVGRHGRSGPVAGLVLVLLLATATAAAAQGGDRPEPVDLNSASLEEVLALPVPPEVAGAIVNYRTYRRYFGDVYELREVDGVTPEIFARLKPLVSTMPPKEQDASIARLSASYRQVQRYLGQEGSNEGLADEYLDKMRNPENVNEADLFDLMSYQNVSPVDATNILKARERLGRFDGQRQLQRAEGVRYWAYRNLRDFVVYSDEEMQSARGDGVTGYFQTRYWETPYSNDDDELGLMALQPLSSRTLPGERYYTGALEPYRPGWLNKIRVNTPDGVTAGLLVGSEYGEKNWSETAKGYAGLHDRRWGPVRLKSLYVGNFRAAYGLGLIMDNTDYIHFRKTGFGFNKRLLGIHGDLSRSYSYQLNGVAAEATVGDLNVSAFFSSTRKDGILNPDGTINRMVTMQPRMDGELLESRETLQNNGAYLPSYLRRRAIEEDLIGANVKYMFAPGTFLGLTGYEARYNRGWNPDPETLLADDTLDPDRGLLDARDTEIWNSYNSVVIESDSTVTEHKWRRVMGAEGQAVLGNVAIQGEYAFLQDPRQTFFNSKNPDAVICNAYAQWENFHLLAIYRDYDVGFDNPYNRAFSNDNRYEQTLLDAPYRLKDDLYAWLESTTPQPKPEKGIFLETRYRVSRQFIISGLQFDQWQRKADGAELMRYTLKAEYQPIFNLRFRMRHRYSSRSEGNPEDVRTYRNWESRWQLIGLLSNYNRIGLTYMTSNVWFPARGRLSGPQDPAGDAKAGIGLAADPSHAFEMRYEHHVTPGLKLTFASSVYDGFLWNFEGNEFVLLDGNGFRNWFKIESRVSERLLFQLKVTRDHNLPKTWLDIRQYGDTPAGNEPDSDYVPGDDTIVRLQMDYTF